MRKNKERKPVITLEKFIKLADIWNHVEVIINSLEDHIIWVNDISLDKDKFFPYYDFIVEHVDIFEGVTCIYIKEE